MDVDYEFNNAAEPPAKRARAAGERTAVAAAAAAPAPGAGSRPVPAPISDIVSAVSAALPPAAGPHTEVRESHFEGRRYRLFITPPFAKDGGPSWAQPAVAAAPRTDAHDCERGEARPSPAQRSGELARPPRR